MCLLSTRSMLLALALSFCVLALGDAERSLGADPGALPQVGKTADGLALYVWDSNQSWPGRPQFDPRLEERITFWSTGIPLSDVFAAVHEQAGVDLGFFPAADQNRRVCVNLYLNPEAPPSLREVMVQLSWVTDCAFAYARADDGLPTYFLLSTSLGSEAEQKVEDEQYAALGSEQREDEQRQAQLRDELMARLPDLRKAVGLTREEAIREYRGKDDLLLLAVLDPGRRAIAQLAVSLSPDQLETVKRHQVIGPKISRWTPEQQGYIREALGRGLPEWLADQERMGLEPTGQWGDWAWVARTDFDVILSTWNGTGFHLSLELLDRESLPSGLVFRGGPSLGSLQLVVDPRVAPLIGHKSQVDLRRLLGEEVDANEERRILGEYIIALDRADRRKHLEAVLPDTSTLSADVADLLTSITLPIQRSGAYALWQIQEAVAAHSGLHVISDCLCQPRYSIHRDFYALHPDGEVEPTAEMALQLSCCPRMLEDWLAPHVGRKGWEWGDAGSFLRFRSRERDTCRGAFLPQRICDVLDGWLQPHLPESLPGDATLPEIQVPLDVNQGIWLLSQLTSLQRTWGGWLIYCDPSDAENAYRHEYRATMLKLISSLEPVYRILEELTEDQWKRLRGDGLVWGVDLSLPVGAEHRGLRSRRDPREGDVLRIADIEPDALIRLRDWGGSISIFAARRAADPEHLRDTTPALIVLRDGKIIAGDALPDRISVRPRLAASLVERR